METVFKAIGSIAGVFILTAVSMAIISRTPLRGPVLNLPS